LTEYSVENAQQEADNLRHMMATPGWKIISHEADERLKAAKDALINAKPEDVAALQASARAYKFVLQFPKDLILSVERATEPAPDKDAVSI
jgi:hypothetical protein